MLNHRLKIWGLCWVLLMCSGCAEEVVSGIARPLTPEQNTASSDTLSDDLGNGMVDTFRGEETDGQLEPDATAVGAECKTPEDCAGEGDDGACTGWICQQGECLIVLLTDGIECDDDNACTFLSRCVEGACLSEETDLCNDGNECTEDVCEPDSGCVNAQVSSVCDDGNPCTADDICVEGVCMGSELDCDDNNTCTDDSCDITEGCRSIPNTEVCDDDDVCTLEDICEDELCVSLSQLDCDDGELCTDDFCDKELGCRTEFNQVSCDDAEPCTAQDTCLEGSCVGIDVDCDDGLSCTVDLCGDTGDCEHLAQTDLCPASGENCTDVLCDLTQGCVYTADDAKCDDEVECTNDQCVQGAGCVHSPDVSFCGLDGSECLTFECVAGTGCVSAPALELCDDGIACTVESCEPSTGTCSVEPIDEECVDPSANCFEFSCDLQLGCVSNPIPDSCDDGIGCTVDSCGEDGLCSFVPSTSYCDNLTKECLTVVECSLSGDCIFEQSQEACDDGVDCTLDSCSLSGTCSHTPDPGFCDDGNPCTDNDCTESGCTQTYNSAPCDVETVYDCGGDMCVQGECTSMYSVSCGDMACVTNNLESLSAGDGLCQPVFECLLYGFDAGDCSNCPAGEIRDCAGQCQGGLYLEQQLGDGICSENMDCSRFGFDAGACSCPEGSIRDCNNNCFTMMEIGAALGNDICDLGSEDPELPALGCEKFAYDDNDCFLDGEPTSIPGYTKNCKGSSTNLNLLQSILNGTDPCTTTTDCEKFDFGGGACFASCEAPSVPSCSHELDSPSCVPMSYVVPKLGNGFCNSLLNCPRFGYDDGDCL